jgi:hypothetical protein
MVPSYFRIADERQYVLLGFTSAFPQEVANVFD